MLENQLMKILVAELRECLLTGRFSDRFDPDRFDVVGQSSAVVRQAYQPTQQGVPLKPAIFIAKLSDRRIGTPRSIAVYNSITGLLDQVDEAYLETSLQISALLRADPADEEAVTASDLLNDVAVYLQSAALIERLGVQGMGVLRIGELRHPYFMDDMDRNEAMPSFDLTVTHQITKVTRTPEVDIYGFNILRV